MSHKAVKSALLATLLWSSQGEAQCVPVVKDFTSPPFPLYNVTSITILEAIPEGSDHKNFTQLVWPQSAVKHGKQIIQCARKTGTFNPKQRRHQLYIGMQFYQSASIFQAATEQMDTFSTALVSFLEEWDLDGVNFDWEQGVDFGVYMDMLKALRKALDAKAKNGKRYLIKLSVFDCFGFDKSIVGVVDTLDFMSYGGSGDCAGRYGSCKSAGIPPSMLVCGNEVEAKWDGCPGWDSQASTIAKTKFALKTGFQGVFSFRLDNDHGYNYGTTCTTCPPSYVGTQWMYDSVIAETDRPDTFQVATYLAANNFNHISDVQLSCPAPPSL